MENIMKRPVYPTDFYENWPTHHTYTHTHTHTHTHTRARARAHRQTKLHETKIRRSNYVSEVFNKEGSLI